MAIDPVSVALVVDSSPERAFAAFTAQIGAWWPLATHSVGITAEKTTPKTVVLEPFEGGRLYEISAAGLQHDWGRVTAWQAGRALAFTWHPGSDPATATHVTVTFAPTDQGKTAVQLTHAGWESLGETAQSTREGYASGWVALMEQDFHGYLARA